MMLLLLLSCGSPLQLDEPFDLCARLHEIEVNETFNCRLGYDDKECMLVGCGDDLSVFFTCGEVWGMRGAMVTATPEGLGLLAAECEEQGGRFYQLDCDDEWSETQPGESCLPSVVITCDIR